MPVKLVGGCLVSELLEGNPVDQSGTRIWRRFDRRTGTEAVTLRILEVPLGVSPGFSNPGCDEVVYCLSGQGTVYLDGWPAALAAGTGLYLKPRSVLTFENPLANPIRLASCRCPDPGVSPGTRSAMKAPRASTGRPSRMPVFQLDKLERKIAGDRWYVELGEPDQRSKQVTQFVAGIPPGRSHDRSYLHEAVLCILRGAGRIRTGEASESAELRPGSCVFVPRGLAHSVENTGDQALQLLGARHPAGSPSDGRDPE